MHFLDLTLEAPEENLALDEALLDLCEVGEIGDTLRFWDPKRYFIVVGYANTVQTEVNLTACSQDGVPVLRRCTGGGTVLQGPGVLNYSLVLRLEHAPALTGIHDTNNYILGAHARALSALLGATVEQEGQTDLAIAGLKFSGNAQRRRRRCVLFHGSLLLSLDSEQVERYLWSPSKEPDYRRKRSHRNFLRNLGVSPDDVKASLRSVWEARDALMQIPHAAVAKLVQEKYSKPEWNFRT